MFPKKYSNLLFILIMGFGMSLMMTLIITYINTGMDSEYINRFLKAWVVSLPIAIIAALVVGPITKNFVDKITK
jgi:phosphate/sulfate permease